MSYCVTLDFGVNSGDGLDIWARYIDRFVARLQDTCSPGEYGILTQRLQRSKAQIEWCKVALAATHGLSLMDGQEWLVTDGWPPDNRMTFIRSKWFRSGSMIPLFKLFR